MIPVLGVLAALFAAVFFFAFQLGRLSGLRQARRLYERHFPDAA